MAWTNANSWIPTATIRDTLNGVIAPKLGPASSADVLKVSLYGGTVTQTIDTDPSHYADAGWGTEVTGTGWTTPQTLSGNRCALYATYGPQFYATSVSVSGTTLSNVYGCTIWDYTISSTVGPVVAAIYFGGTAYNTSAGTFGITWQTVNSQPTIWYIQLH